MEIDFFIHKPDTTELQVIDNTRVSTISVPEDYTEMKLTIRSIVIPNTGIVADINIIEYIQNKRVDRELYTITPTTLGLTSTNIPDGYYEFEFSVNSVYVTTKKYIIYQNVLEEYNEVLEDSTTNVDMNDYGEIRYIEPTTEYDMEKIYLVGSVLEELKAQRFDPDEDKVNELVDKAERLLGIIKTELT